MRLSMKYRVLIEQDEDGVFVAQVPALPGCVTQGTTRREAVDQNLATLTEISRDLRRDRELAFYGAEDLTPSGFYSLDDAEKARSGARLTVKLVEPHVGSG